MNENKDAREARLAAALRENLRRRKARARGEDSAAAPAARDSNGEDAGRGRG